MREQRRRRGRLVLPHRIINSNNGHHEVRFGLPVHDPQLTSTAVPVAIPTDPKNVLAALSSLQISKLTFAPKRQSTVSMMSLDRLFGWNNRRTKNRKEEDEVQLTNAILIL